MTADLGDVPPELRDAVALTLDMAGVSEGHLAVTLAGEDRIRELNREHRGINRPTDVLAFPLDETAPVPGPRELGDVVICPAQATDVVEAAVHGTLHLCGYDHETDDGDMLARQARILGAL